MLIGQNSSYLRNLKLGKAFLHKCKVFPDPEVGNPEVFKGQSESCRPSPPLPTASVPFPSEEGKLTTKIMTETFQLTVLGGGLS